MTIHKVNSNKPKLLLIIHNNDISYVTAVGSSINKYFSGTGYYTKKVSVKTEVLMEAKRRKLRHIGTTNFKLLKLFKPSLEGTYNDNVGTVVETKGLSGEKVRIILLPYLKSIYTKNSGKFLLEHYCAKLANGGVLKKDPFHWKFVKAQNLEQVIQDIEASPICAVDLETSRQDLKITSVAYTWLNPDRRTTSTAVIRCCADTYPFCISAMRRINNTSTAKVMQNGQYDSTYFLRFNAPLCNWIFDTYHLMHAIFAELPRDLAFISSFFLDNFYFWKEEAGENLYEYNGKDTHNTLWVFLAMMSFIQKAEYHYALKNYLLLFPINFPLLSCGLDGFLVDEEQKAILRQKEVEQKEKSLERVNYLIGETNFNPSSPKQVKQLMDAFGWKKYKSSDVKELSKWKDKAPLTGRIVDAILDYRHSVKAVGTYFDIELLGGRLLYQLNPSGTETGRTASKASNFWCGTQIQNIPLYARAMCKADEGWTLGAVDKAQSESYCTGFLSRDLKLIDAVVNSPDFHCHNASMFFGIPFEELFDEKTKTKLKPEIRKLAKPINHGANYNMQGATLLETMGEKNVLKAQSVLKLPAGMTLIQVCENLLMRFDRTYPRVRDTSKGWYRELIMEVVRTGKLKIPAIGYTRKTFLKPHKNKMDLNTVVSHKPQSLSVALVNKALMIIWRELQLGKYSGKFRLKAQVHDEIVHQTKDELIDKVNEEIAEIMVIPTEVEGRTMVIPSTTAKGKYWDECKD